MAVGADIVTLRPQLSGQAYERLRSASYTAVTSAADAISAFNAAGLLAMGGRWSAAIRKVQAGVDALEQSLGAARTAIAEMEGLARPAQRSVPTEGAR